jgi:hypothetical protein
MEKLFEVALQMVLAGGAASYGLCVDRACPGSALDPLTCTFCCCGMVPTVRRARAARAQRAAATRHVARAPSHTPRRMRVPLLSPC